MVTLERVDQMRKRTNCSYEEAKFFLEKHNGDVLEAIVDFEKSKSNSKYAYNNDSPNYNNKKQMNDFWLSVKRLIQKGFEYRVVIEDKGNVFLNIPVNIMLLLVICISYIAIPAILLMLLLGYKLSIRKPQGEEVDISSMMKDMTGKFTCQNTTEQNQSQDVPVPEAEEQKEDYNEMTIE